MSEMDEQELFGSDDDEVPQTGPTVTIGSAVVDMYERLFHNEESKDVQIVAQDGEVRAHSLVLSELAEPFRKMLEHPMKEGRTKVIKLEAYSVSQLRFFLRLAYTGLVDASDWEEAKGVPPLDLLLAVVILAKEYEVKGFSDWMLDKIKSRVNIRTFEEVAGAATKHNISPLLQCCLKFAEKNREIRSRFEEGALKPEVAWELRAIWGPPGVERRGKKRKAL